MKLIFPRLGASLLLVSFLAACSLPQVNPTADTGIVATKVAETLAAFTQAAKQTTLPSPTSPSSITPTASMTLTLEPTTTTGFTTTPTETINPTVTKRPTETPTSLPGTIAGSIYGYPYGSIPDLAIVAFGQEPPYNYSYMITAAGQTYFSMTTKYLLPGHYQVVAYDSSGNTGGCVINLLVISDQTVTCDITNWGGGYPAKPSGVPNP
jgi:hypothetical protein